MRLTYLLIVFMFLQIHLDSPSRQKTYLKKKVLNKIQFFTLESIHTCDDLFSYLFNYLCRFHTISKLKRMNNKSFCRILLILSGDSNEWNAFRSKVIHLIYLKVNSILSKIDEIRYIAECTKAAVTGITDFKLDESVFQSEI